MEIHQKIWICTVAKFQVEAKRGTWELCKFLQFKQLLLLRASGMGRLCGSSPRSRQKSAINVNVSTRSVSFVEWWLANYRLSLWSLLKVNARGWFWRLLRTMNEWDYHKVRGCVCSRFNHLRYKYGSRPRVTQSVASLS